MFKWILFLGIIFSFSSSFAFEYNQKMIEYQGGVISQLNNCGVSYNKDGIFSRGLHGITSPISSPENTVVDFKKMGEGVVSVLDDGRVYYSPNGRSLDGGNESILIRDIELDYRPCTSPRCTGIVTAKILGLEVQGDYIAILTTQKMYMLNFQAGRLNQSVDHDFSYTQSCNFRGCQPTVITTKMISAVSVNGGLFYVQFSNGDIRYSSSIGELAATKQLRSLQSAAPPIKQIVPYGVGIATLLNDSRIIYSSNITNPTSGTLLYDGRNQKKVSSIMSYGGYGASNIFVNFIDGYTTYSPYGTNLLGGGDTIEVMKPIDTNAVRDKLVAQFEPIKQQQINSYGHLVVKTEIKTKILNKGDSIEFSGSWAAGYDGSNIVAANAVDFSGKPVSVKVFDKGWDGIEYKWRGRNEQKGTVIHSHDFDTVGRSEIKLTSQKTCAIVGGVSQIGEFPNPFKTNISIEPKFFYSEVRGPGVPTSGNAFFMNLIGVGRDLFFGDNGWNIWTFWTSGGEAFGPMMQYIQYNNNIDFGLTFDRYSRTVAKKYLPGYQSGTDEVQISTNYIVRHKTGGYCLHPKGGALNPSVGTPLILHADCNPFEERLQFTIQPNGSLRHVSSGLCVHPEGGTASTGRKLILWNSCSDGLAADDAGNKRLAFEFESSGSLKHKGSGLCVHPSGGATNPAAGTELLLWSGCNESRLKYSRY